MENNENKHMEPVTASKFPVICKCPICGGNICEGAKGYFCSNYRTGCKVSGYKMILTTPIMDTDFTKLLAGEIIEKKLKKDDREWVQKIRYNFEENKMEFVKAKQKVFELPCPKCGAPMTDYEKGVFCTDRNGCKFVLWKNFLGHTFTTDEIKILLSGQTTQKITLRGRTGKTFESGLSYDFDNERVVFDF